MDSAGTLTSITTLPITVDVSTNPAVPALALDIDSLTISSTYEFPISR